MCPACTVTLPLKCHHTSKQADLDILSLSDTFSWRSSTSNAVFNLANYRLVWFSILAIYIIVEGWMITQLFARQENSMILQQQTTTYKELAQKESVYHPFDTIRQRLYIRLWTMVEELNGTFLCDCI